DNNCDGTVDWGSVALSLDGSEDFLSLDGFDTSLYDGITLEAWVRADSVASSTHTVFYKSQNTGDTDAFLGLESSGWEGALHLGGTLQTVSPGPTATTDTWTHVALTYDGADLLLYVDGVVALTESDSAGLDLGGAGTWSIGASWDGVSAATGFWEGLLDEVRMWGVARTGAQLQETMCEPITG
ncbi:MAG TPA: hypothetical protein DIU15_18940, partial [Deltaproteobacteria bacterium]|nr:hypothetical protein [Deltaproteobacteria bacterium]